MQKILLAQRCDNNNYTITLADFSNFSNMVCFFIILLKVWHEFEQLGHYYLPFTILNYQPKFFSHLLNLLTFFSPSSKAISLALIWFGAFSTHNLLGPLP